MKEVDNILLILNETLKAIKAGDSAYIKNLSDRTTNTASLTQDPDNIAVAVIIYSLSKIIEREGYKKLPGWARFYKRYIIFIEKVIASLKEDDETETRTNLARIRKEINKLSGKLREYIKDIFRKAEINKALKIYEHGISMEQTAKLLGITMFELASYAGQKEVIKDIPGEKTIDAKSRIKIAIEMFS